MRVAVEPVPRACVIFRDPLCEIFEPSVDDRDLYGVSVESCTMPTAGGRGWFMCLSFGASCLAGGNGLLGEVAQIWLHDVGVPAKGWVYYWDESAVRVLRVNVLRYRGECRHWAADSDRQRRCGSRLVGGLGV